MDPSAAFLSICVELQDHDSILAFEPATVTAHFAKLDAVAATLTHALTSSVSSEVDTTPNDTDASTSDSSFKDDTIATETQLIESSVSAVSAAAAAGCDLSSTEALVSIIAATEDFISSHHHYDSDAAVAAREAVVTLQALVSASPSLPPSNTNGSNETGEASTAQGSELPAESAPRTSAPGVGAASPADTRQRRHSSGSESVESSRNRMVELPRSGEEAVLMHSKPSKPSDLFRRPFRSPGSVPAGSPTASSMNDSSLPTNAVHQMTSKETTAHHPSHDSETSPQFSHHELSSSSEVRWSGAALGVGEPSAQRYGDVEPTTLDQRRFDGHDERREQHHQKRRRSSQRDRRRGGQKGGAGTPQQGREVQDRAPPAVLLRLVNLAEKGHHPTAWADALQFISESSPIAARGDHRHRHDSDACPGSVSRSDGQNFGDQKHKGSYPGSGSSPSSVSYCDVPISAVHAVLRCCAANGAERGALDVLRWASARQRAIVDQHRPPPSMLPPLPSEIALAFHNPDSATVWGGGWSDSKTSDGRDAELNSEKSTGQQGRRGVANNNNNKETVDGTPGANVRCSDQQPGVAKMVAVCSSNSELTAVADSVPPHTRDQLVNSSTTKHAGEAALELRSSRLARAVLFGPTLSPHIVPSGAIPALTALVKAGQWDVAAQWLTARPADDVVSRTLRVGNAVIPATLRALEFARVSNYDAREAEIEDIFFDDGRSSASFLSADQPDAIPRGVSEPEQWEKAMEFFTTRQYWSVDGALPAAVVALRMGGRWQEACAFLQRPAAIRRQDFTKATRELLKCRELPEAIARSVKRLPYPRRR